ncbi:MAG TPA: ABC transporter permease [Candidatus Eisenbacteria bacterium]|nr:ABC transporter permease [Candidatus Eisenbacteria bacterium]
MRLLDSLRLRIAALFERSQMNAEMEDELRSHIQHRADDLERAGLARAEAERRARIEFGGYQRVKEECHEAAGGTLVASFGHDVRYAIRILRKSPGFTIVAVLTLALAIGANALVFGVLNALILRPLDLPGAQSLYAIEDRGGTGYESYPDYIDLRDRNRSFEGLAAYNIAQAGLDTGKDPAPAWVYEISGNYFDALGIQPYLGRMLHASDEHGENSAPYVVLSYAYWHSHFQDDREVVGHTVQLNKHPYTILGVTPPEFRGTLLFFSPDIFVPIVNHEQLAGASELEQRGRRWVFELLGHLKPGISPTQATADLNAVAAYLEKTYPQDDGKLSFTLGRPGLYGSFLGGPVRAFVAGLMLLAGLILLAACANLGSLFAARAADRAREIALRLALGSSRFRVLRQLLVEATLIALAGGTLGLLSSIALLRRLSVWQPIPRFPIHVPVSPDARVYGVALVLALVSGLLFGIVPVRQVLRTSPYEVVKSGSTGMIGRRVTARDMLLVTQIAICAVLVTASMVAVRGLVRSLHSNFGFEPQNAMLVETELSMAGYRGEAVPVMQKRMRDALAAIPGVQAVGLGNTVPLNMDTGTGTVYSDKETDLRPSNAAAKPYLFQVSPGYFEATGTTLLAGRTFTWHDDGNAPLVAVVNQEFARKVLGSVEDGVGRYYKTKDGTRIQVVGIVEDGKYLNLTEDQKPALFLAILQSPVSQTWLVVRSSADPQQLAAAIRAELHRLDAGLTIYVEPWNKEIQGVLFPMRMATVSLGILGVMGAMLSITGIFGMAAYSVSKRLKELGIRIALGAEHREVLKAALGRALKLLVFGSAAGLVLGVLASRVLASIVYQATPRDPLVLGGVVLAMLLLGLVATWIPARRVLSIDPLVLLREE